MREHTVGPDMGTTLLRLGITGQETYPNAQALYVIDDSFYRPLVVIRGLLDGVPHVGHVIVAGRFEDVVETIKGWGNRVTIVGAPDPDLEMEMMDGRIVIPLVGRIVEPSPDQLHSLRHGQAVAIRVPL